MERKEYRLNEVIFADGVYQNWMYSICEGSVEIYSEYGTPAEKLLTTLKKGQYFGEIGMIAETSRTATAVAAEKTVILEQIGSDDLVDYLKNHPENLQPIMSSVSRRIRDLTEDMSGINQMVNVLLGDKETDNAKTGRVAEFVNRLLGNLKAKKGFGNEFEVLYKRQQALAGAIPPVIRYAAGDVIFRAGEQADCMYEIYNGCVGIYSDYQTEDEKLLTKLNGNSVFGEMGVLDDMPRSATAVCLTDCSVLVVKAERFMQFFQEKPEKLLKILQQMCVRLKDLTKTYVQVCETLEAILSPVEEELQKNVQEDVALAKLEQIRQDQIYASLYDISNTTAWMYGYCK